jgi:glutathione synthase/RimK-type ligase-like ATP-grasp enzyme
VILVISHEQDPHAARVIRQLQADGRHVLLFNLTELPDRATLSIEYDRNGQPRIDYAQSSGTSYPLHDVTAVWWRRPQVPDLSSVTDPQVNLFTANEWNEAINGLWQLLDARWMNDPTCDDAASRKARQLRVAAEVGLKVPRTLITSDPARARRFVTELGPAGTIYKTFSCTHAIWRETRLLKSDDLAHLDAVRVAPVIFQEFIPAESDLRITAVGGQLFGASIRSVARDGLVDFRMSVGDAELAAAALPADISDKLQTLQRRLGLVYGAIDMRRTPDGEYYFFEVNTAGEFLFIEDRTDQPIAKAIADWLAEPGLARKPASPRRSASRSKRR